MGPSLWIVFDYRESVMSEYFGKIVFITKMVEPGLERAWDFNILQKVVTIFFILYCYGFTGEGEKGLLKRQIIAMLCISIFLFWKTWIQKIPFFRCEFNYWNTHIKIY